MTTLSFNGRYRVWLAGLLLLLLLAILDDYAGWRFLFLSGVIVLGISRLWAGLLAQGLSFEREMRFGWAQVGDRLEERFTLSNSSPAPALWVEVQDRSTLPDYHPGMVTGVDGGGRATWHSEGMCTRRGLYTLGPTRILTSDPLGLFLICLEDARQAQIMVTPPVVALPHIDVAPGGQAGEGRPRRGGLERTISASGVREYVPGDPLRHIHWPTTARRAEPFVRTFENTPAGSWWIILDLAEKVQAGQAPRSTEEHAIMLAASLMDRGLRMTRAVGLLCNGEPFTFITPQTGDGQRWAILRALAVLRPGQRPLAELLARLESRLSGQSSLVVITADMSGAWVERLLPLIWKGASPTLLLLDPRRFEDGGDEATPSATRLAALLGDHGLRHEIIGPELLDRPAAQPGRRGKMRWRVTPSGRAILESDDLRWRQLH